MDELLRRLERAYSSSPTDELRVELNRLRRRRGLRKKILIIHDGVDQGPQIPDSIFDYFEVFEWSFRDAHCGSFREPPYKLENTRCTADDIHKIAPDLIIIIYPSTYERRQYRYLLSGAIADPHAVVRFMVDTSRYSNWMGMDVIEGVRPIPIIAGIQWGQWMWRNGEASPSLNNIDWFWDYPESGVGINIIFQRNPIRRNPDNEIRRLERALSADPSDSEIIGKLERARRRAGIITCEHCGQMIASGCECDTSACRYIRRVAHYLDGVEHFSTGLASNCDSCGTQDIDELDEEMVDESSFSSYPCEVCDSGLGGSRHAAHGYIDEEMSHFSICEDCLFYINYGTTPEDY